MNRRAAERMSRRARTFRGAVGATLATLIAGVSHAVAGGSITWLALVATALVALPLCVLLAGRVGSLWRLSLAVTASQFLFHWSFAGLGASTGTLADPLPLHASHTMPFFTPDPAAASSGIAMWACHLIAAAFTIALLHRGERAFASLLRFARRVIALAQPRALSLPAAALPAPGFEVAPLFSRLLLAGAVTRRGPPVVS